ncbi:hypothetical protein FS837_008184 [Tulasnella sp. UAMH 9824]|nr:hypothetical protein FS837_008184 [Tulasnella sp. UAMH 9824]
MQGNNGEATDPSQVSESGTGQGDSPSAFLHSSKLRNKLEKLAQWRIDPSLIEIPGGAREFHGGFATVTQAFLASPSKDEGGPNESGRTTDERPDADAGDAEPHSDTQVRGDNQQVKFKSEEADSRRAGDNNDDTQEKSSRKSNSDEEHQPHRQTSPSKVVDEPSHSASITNEDPVWSDCDPQSQSATQEPQDKEQGKDEGTDSRIADGNNDQTKDEGRRQPKGTDDDKNSDIQNSKPKLVAVKKLKIEEDTDLDRVLGLALRESEFLVALSHPNIVKLEGFVEDVTERKVWLIFSWEEHGNLRDFLASGDWEIPERISLIQDVTLGLEYLHSRDPPIYHGDLKSLNILVNSEYHALITDFGSARHLENDRVGKQSKGTEDSDEPRPAIDPSTAEECITLEALFSATASTLTLTGSSYTLRWAAPELLQDDRPCLRSDIWSLGWIAYEPMIVPAPTQGMNEEDSPARYAQLLHQLGQMYKRQGDYLNALNCFTKASDIYTINHDNRAKAQNLRSLAELHLFRGEHTEAESFYTEALQIYSESGDQIEKAHAIWGIAEVRRIQEDFNGAKTLYSECLKIFTGIDLRRSRADSLFGLAGVHQSQSEYSEARKLYSEALEIFTDIGDTEGRGNALWSLGEVHRNRREYSEATERYSDALEISTEIGDKQGRASALWGLAEVYVNQGDYDDAIKRSSEATEIFTDMGDKYWRAEALMTLAQSHRMLEGLHNSLSASTTSPLLMQVNENNAADPSQASAPNQGDSPYVFLHSSKLRNKLEKLAQWRIDPSLIEIPGDAREFHGGFATVSQAFLASPPKDDRGTNESERTTDERPDADAGDAQPHNDIQERGYNQQASGEEADSRRMGDNNDDTQEKASKTSNSDEEHQPHHQTSPSKVVGDPSPPARIMNEDPVRRDLSPQSRSGTQELQSKEQGKDEGTDSCIADGSDDRTKDEGGKQPEGTDNDKNSNNPNSEPKLVAVKKLKIEEDTDLERVLGLALREFEFLVELSHPNIVKLEGFVEDVTERKVWLIFSWEEHGNLRDFLASGEWEIPERISLIHNVTLGLEYLHSRDPPIYHGDLKSLNILVNSGYHALITDFGSARHLENDRVGKRSKDTEDSNDLRPVVDPSTAEECITLEALFSATASTLTLTGSSYTLRWAAPELLQDDRPCLRSDIWSLGWIAYEVGPDRYPRIACRQLKISVLKQVMTNTIPFHDVKKDAIVINRVIQGHLPAVTEDARMSLIRALCSVMVQCWNMNPYKRPTAEECRKLISWMPMIVPAPTRSINEQVSSSRYARLLNQLGQMYKRQGDYLNALNCFTQASNIYTVNHDNTGKAQNLCSLADLHIFMGERTKAASFYTEALQIYTESGDQIERAHAVYGVADARRIQGEFEEAKKLYSECLQIYTGIDLRRSRANSLFGLASVHEAQCEYSVAETLYLEALEIFTDVGDSEGRGGALFSLGEVHRLRGQYSEAAKRSSEALEICTEIGNRQGRATALWSLAQIHAYRGEFDDSIKFSSEAKEIFTDMGDKYWRAEALISLARFHEMQGHHSETISYYEQASKDLEETGDPGRAADALKNAEEIRKTLEEGVTWLHQDGQSQGRLVAELRLM